MGILNKIIQNPLNLMNELKQYFSDDELRMSIKDLKMYKDTLPSFQLSFEITEFAFDKLDGLYDSKSISISDVIRDISSKDKYIKNLLDIVIKEISNNKILLEHYQKNGLVMFFKRITKGWKNVISELNDKIDDLIDKCKNSDSKILLLSDSIDVITLSLIPYVDTYLDLYFSILSLYNIDNKDELIDRIQIVGKSITNLSKNFELITKVILIIGYTDGVILDTFKNSIVKKGLNFNIFNNTSNKSSSPFNIFKLSDFGSFGSAYMRLAPVSRAFLSGNIRLWLRVRKIDKIKEKKEWVEQRILYLKMLLADKKNENELENIKEALDYYENLLVKLNKKLDELYD